jgi:hypothetical protein
MDRDFLSPNQASALCCFLLALEINGLYPGWLPELVYWKSIFFWVDILSGIDFYLGRILRQIQYE